ncbi:ACT domain-containing protein [Lachnoanaerobaculum sp. Marseille-Q4761]|uniref:ACT domain-containing protein n=1 Tax=Lachnoanaerobaculum sp. Marseille-Q4761 TaxID=2819511 RepID=UPI001FB82D06|nr:ACT domain-containing protein [Lachnoanaerobaculum sp. Marseille-Q4761]
MNKVIITVVGKDTVGIIAGVCTYLANNKINILDISQTIVSGYFNMMMITDMEKSTVNFTKVSEDLDSLGDSIGVKIKAQKEEIFESMHRL